MVIQCAWCKKILGEKAPVKDTSITHSICVSCMKNMKKNPPPIEWETIRVPGVSGQHRKVGPVTQFLFHEGKKWLVAERASGERDVAPIATLETKIEALALLGIRAAEHLTGGNPGEAWHAEKEREAEASERTVKKASLKDFYHGKAIAHFESGLKARALKRESINFVRRNPIAVFGLGNPPNEVRAKVSGIVYNRCLEVRAEKTGSFKRGLWKHPFLKDSQVQVLALDNGDLLLHSVAGVRLWRKA
jgi:hypothetical protein